MTRTQRLGNLTIKALVVAATFGLPVLIAGPTVASVVVAVVVAAWMLS